VTWREYHESTKHTVESLRRSTHFLDWANMPDPFRHYEGVPVLDLPADPPAPGASPALDGAAFLSQLLFYSAAISASKRVPSTGDKYALRVNPSSGNLHPTEFHFFTRGLRDWPDGLYHYRPSSHMAEQRALGLGLHSAPFVFVLTSIAWREAWKYRERAYRYCLLDIGHAWQALALAARAMGCDSFALGHFVDDEIAQLCRLHEDEWPMLMVEIRPPLAPENREAVWFGGVANQLSKETIEYPSINAVHQATKAVVDTPSIRGFGEIARRRRSALDFQGGTRTMPLAHLMEILASATAPFHADFAGARFIQLYLYLHRVDGLQPGVYRFSWEGSELEQVKLGDQRVVAAGLSLGQDLAGNACVAFSMIGDLERAARIHGARGYRYVHFEAGAIGHRMYLAAEALGMGATGIGAFYDDEVHRYLNLTPERGQVVYHFAIGHPVPDPRLEA
jgi:SagB-type dehydrogenase family enzyme